MAKKTLIFIFILLASLVLSLSLCVGCGGEAEPASQPKQWHGVDVYSGGEWHVYDPPTITRTFHVEDRFRLDWTASPNYDMADADGVVYGFISISVYEEFFYEGEYLEVYVTDFWADVEEYTSDMFYCAEGPGDYYLEINVGLLSHWGVIIESYY